METEVRLSLEKQIRKKEKISLTNGWHQYVAFILLITDISLTITGIFLLKDFYTSAAEDYVAAVAGILLVSFFVYRLCIQTGDVAVKNDILFINCIFSACKIVPIEKLYKIRSFSFACLNLTILKYEVDGIKRKVYLFNRIKGKNQKPSSILELVSGVPV